MNGAKVALAITSLVLGGTLIYVLTRPEAEALTPPPEEEEEIIDAGYISGYVHWAALADWRRVYISRNEWPADTDIALAWEIRNKGNVGAYFQVYLFEPGTWFYLDPGEATTVYEEAHTPALPVMPSYQYNNRITILARKLDGERMGSVWTSEDFEILYV